MHYKKALVAIFLLASCLFSAPDLLAYTDFSDANLWRISMHGTGFSATANTTQLDLTIPTDSTGNAGVISKFTVIGDFDVRVNYVLNTWPSNNGIGLSLGFHTLSGGAADAVIGRNENSYVWTIQINPAYHEVYTAPTSDTSGALRLTRTNDTITAYYLNGAWQTLGSATDAILAHDGIYTLLALETSTPNVGTASVTFSNFSQVPIPPTILLLGGGLVGLVLPGLRRRMKKT